MLNLLLQMVVSHCEHNATTLENLAYPSFPPPAPPRTPSRRTKGIRDSDEGRHGRSLGKRRGETTENIDRKHFHTGSLAIPTGDRNGGATEPRGGPAFVGQHDER